MKKAVVLEIKDNYAAVLSADGIVKKIRNVGYSTGQELDLDNVSATCALTARMQRIRPRLNSWRRAAVVVATVFAVSGGGYCYAAENMLPYSTVTLTTEDSAMELTLNKKDEVLSVKALDEQSEKDTQSMEISFRKRTPFAETLNTLANEKDLTGVSVVSKNEEKKELLQKEINELLPVPAAEQPEPQDIQPMQTQERTQSSANEFKAEKNTVTAPEDAQPQYAPTAQDNEEANKQNPSFAGTPDGSLDMPGMENAQSGTMREGVPEEPGVGMQPEPDGQQEENPDISRSGEEPAQNVPEGEGIMQGNEIPQEAPAPILGTGPAAPAEGFGNAEPGPAAMQTQSAATD